MGKMLLEVGTQTRWWCPVCGCVLTKAQYLHDDRSAVPSGRYHSVRCHEPMRRVEVTVTERAS